LSNKSLQEEGNEMEKEEEVRLIAYSLWVRDGYPHGRAIEHWLRAESIWEVTHIPTHNPGAQVVLAFEEAGEDNEDAAASDNADISEETALSYSASL
jgi:hypothetical protein